MRDPVLVGPYWLSLIFWNSHSSTGTALDSNVVLWIKDMPNVCLNTASSDAAVLVMFLELFLNPWEPELGSAT